MSPFPSIEALGRYARQLSDAQHVFDIADDQTEPASKAAYWREEAVQQLILTLQPRTMADAVVTLGQVMAVVENLRDSIHTKHETDLALDKVRRALAGLLPVIIEAVGADAAELVDPFFIKLGAEIFEPLTHQLEKARAG